MAISDYANLILSVSSSQTWGDTMIPSNDIFVFRITSEQHTALWNLFYPRILSLHNHILTDTESLDTLREVDIYYSQNDTHYKYQLRNENKVKL